MDSSFFVYDYYSNPCAEQMCEVKKTKMKQTKHQKHYEWRKQWIYGLHSVCRFVFCSLLRRCRGHSGFSIIIVIFLVKDISKTHIPFQFWFLFFCHFLFYFWVDFCPKNLYSPLWIDSPRTECLNYRFRLYAGIRSIWLLVSGIWK